MAAVFISSSAGLLSGGAQRTALGDPAIAQAIVGAAAAREAELLQRVEQQLSARVAREGLSSATHR